MSHDPARRLRRRREHSERRAVMRELHQLVRLMVRTRSACPFCGATPADENGAVLYVHDDDCVVARVGAISVKRGT